MNAQIREIVGLHVGSKEICGRLWDSLPDCHLNAEVYTDKHPAYKAGAYDKYHSQGRVTQHIERLYNTLRQRIPRLIRKTLGFSKGFAKHIGALWLFVHHYPRSSAL